MNKISPNSVIEINGQPLKTNSTGLISLTDMFNAAAAQGWTDGKLEPKKWAQAPYAKKSGSTGKTSVSGGQGVDFIEFVAENLKVNAADVYKAVRGKHGGTFAHWQIALAYAKYLSPALHMQVNDVYARYKTADVTLAADIADKAKPADAAWLARRVQGTVARNQFTSTLAAHGVAGKGFADCTNAIYKNVLGGNKSEICAERGLRKGTNLRNVMDVTQLTATAMIELVAQKRIDSLNVRGSQACTVHCDHAGAAVMKLLQTGLTA